MQSETALIQEGEPDAPKKVRFERLREVLRLAVNQTVKRVLTSEHFSQCFPRIASMEVGEATIDFARKQVAQYFTSTSMEQFEHIFHERNIENRLNELDEIIHSSQQRKDTRTGRQLLIDEIPPEEIINLAVTKLKLLAIENLQVIYDQLCNDNDDLYSQLKENTETCEDLKNEVISLVDSLQSGIDEIKRLNFELLLENLAEEVFGD